MPERRRAGRWIAGIVVCAALAAVVVGFRHGFPGARKNGAGVAGAPVDENSTLEELAAAAQASDPRALVALERRVPQTNDVSRTAYADEEVGAWLHLLEGLRSGFLGYKPAGRAIAMGLACRIFDRFSVEPAPPRWAEALPKLHDLLTAGMTDAEPALRVETLEQVGKLWVWLPGRSMTPIEEDSLVRWKEQLYQPAVRCLGHRDTSTLVAAIHCLAALPIDDAAAPAMAYLDNSSVEVRKQTILAFARRNTLLTDDLLLNRLHDIESAVRKAATKVLTSRGLSDEQIGLGALIFSPNPQERLKVIPLLKDRTDIDPSLWLIQLSHDPEEMVRIGAVEAMGKMTSKAVSRRLTEMARSDASEAVRRAAGKLAPAAAPQRTAALPPLPGSPSLNPKAN